MKKTSAWDLHRRDFLLTALVLAACGSDGSDGPSGSGGNAGAAGSGGSGGDGGTDPRVPFGVWEEVRAAIRKSPDHLVAEAERVVASKDPVAIFELVRDQFVTLPATPTTIGGTTERLFGLRGTLRSGSGTMRDKAELLAHLYTQAGFQAEVVRIPTPPDPEFVKKALVRSVTRVFSPDVTEAQAARWLELLGMTRMPVEVIDEGRVAAEQLVSSLLTVLPQTVDAQAFSFTAPISIPIVSVQVAGEQKLANPQLPDLAFGDSGTTLGPQTISDAQPLPKVKATVSIVNSADPKVPVDLVSGEFASEDLIGRSLYVMMVPPEGLAESLRTPLDHLRTFAPALSLQGPGLEQSVIDANTVVGSAVTRGGDVFVAQSDGTLALNGTVLDTSPYDPAKAASVATLQAQVSASSFRRVSLRVAALDASGNSVPGLPASAFALAEEGTAQVFTLLENQSPPPRVLFVLDKSTSLPPAFQGAAAAALVKDMASAVLASYPGASFRIHTVGGNPDHGSWTSDPVALEAAALSQSGLGSDLWLALGQAAKLGATTIVFVTDGDATDTPTPEKLSAISVAPPSVFLIVGGGATTTLDQMAEITAGAVVPVTDQAQAQAQTSAFIAARQKSAYLLRYDAPEAGPTTRNVQLSLRDGPATATVNYDVPPPAEVKTPNRVGGILLTLQVGGATPVTRVLAGTREVTATTPESVFQEAYDAFLGTFEVRFEGGAPTVATVLDDWISARLALEPLWDATRGSDEAAIVDAWLKTPPVPSAAAAVLHAPLAAKSGSGVFPTGLRASIHVTQPRGKNAIARRVDLVPLGPYGAIDVDARAALVEAMTATARHALIEDELWSTSTKKLLLGVPLMHLPPFTSVESVISGLSQELRDRWRLAMNGYSNAHRLIPASGTPVAFWHLAPTTGALLGVLERGNGGAEDIEQYQSDMNTLIDLANRLAALASLAGVLGAAGGTWLSLELTKAKKLLGATVVIAGGTPSSDPTNWNDFGCTAVTSAASAAAGAVGGVVGAAAEAAGQADSAATAVTGNGLFC